MDKNPHAVALGRLGGLVGGRARAAGMSPERRLEIARLAAKKRWTAPDLRDRPTRRRIAHELAAKIDVDEGVAEQVLFLQTLPPWERLARGLYRARLRKVPA